VTVDVHTVESTARRVARDYLGVGAGERFAIVVDTRTDIEIPDALAAAARDTPLLTPLVEFIAGSVRGIIR